MTAVLSGVSVLIIIINMKICLLVLLLLLWMVTGGSKAEGQSIVDISKFIKTFSPKFISGNGEAPEIPKVDKLARSESDTGRELDSKYIQGVYINCH